MHSWMGICLAMLIVLAAPSVESEPQVPNELVEDLASASAGSDAVLVRLAVSGRPLPAGDRKAVNGSP